MKLTFEQVKSVTFGAVNVYADERGIHFRRFTDRQLAVWDQLSEQFKTRSRGTAGCQLSFYTNSQNMMLDIASGVKFEILVNGLPIACFQLESPRRLPVSLGEGEKHVVITLPNYTEAILNYIAIDEGAYVRPYEHRRKFLFLGDSITQGSQSTRDTFCYAHRISRFFDAEYMNWGIGGSYMVADTLEDVGFDPDAVFIAYGTNDYTLGVSLESLEKACREYFDRVQALFPNKKIFYISPLWRADNALLRKTGTLDDCREVFIRECEKHGFIHIDGYCLVPHMEFYFKDGYLHPNDLGFSYYSENLIKFLVNHL